MARVTGPLMSMDASGSIGKSIVFVKWKGRSYVRGWVIPHNPKSDAQTGTRAMMRFLTQEWNAITGMTKATWDAAASSEKISPFNRYVQVNMRQFTQFLFPSKAFPINPISTPPGALVVAATGGVGEISGTLTQVTPFATWGFAVLISGAIIPARTDVKLVLGTTGNTPVSFTVSGLPPGTYNCQGLAFNDDGVISAPSNMVPSIAVT